jgi:DNA-binding MarR family transcriptional regulator
VTKQLPINGAGIQDIDKLIHEPSRLMIMANLYVVQSADFLFLQNQTGMTPGNLSAHLSKLEDAGYVEVTKEFIERKPHTALALTKKGRDAFKTYRKKMKQVFNDLPKEEENRFSKEQKNGENKSKRLLPQN